ncbi:MAG: hypothetical protein J0I06_11300 [Planctomycetes bacterium]|nr:hypothetical protein [Planctomycetota bacterium]
MRSLRTIGVGLLFALVTLTTASPAARADDGRRHDRRHGYHNDWYGGYNRPYYWNNSNYYNPYRGYNPYRNWAGTVRGYYGRYPYYNSARTYPWGWYW